MNRAWAFGGVWIMFWTGTTLLFDYQLVNGLLTQAQSRHWPTAAGHVVGAEVKVDHDSEGGTSYKPKIVYEYTVNGMLFSRDRIREGTTISGRRAAQAAVAKYPKGSTVTVHYKPHQHSTAVLETTLVSGGDLFGSIFGVPLNVIMLLGWRMAAEAIFGNKRTMPAGASAKVIEGPGGTGVRVNFLPPMATGLAVAAVTAFVLVFAIGCTVGSESVNAGAVGWALIIGLSTIAYVWKRNRVNAGWYDLLIHDGRRVIAMPPSVERPDVAEMRFEDVAAIEVYKKVGTGDDSDQYQVFIEWTARGRGKVKLLETTNEKPAEALAAWMRTRLEVAPREPEAASNLETSAA